jgi:hypothetical protein
MSSVLSAIGVNSSHVDLTDRFQISTAVVASPATSAETAIAAIAITKALSTTTGVIVIGQASYTAGTSGVSGRLRLYHGTASGTKIADSGLVTIVATDLYSPVLIGLDAAPVLPNQTYTMTLTIGSGAAQSLVSEVALIAIVV